MFKGERFVIEIGISIGICVNKLIIICNGKKSLSIEYNYGIQSKYLFYMEYIYLRKASSIFSI